MQYNPKCLVAFGLVVGGYWLLAPSDRRVSVALGLAIATYSPVRPRVPNGGSARRSPPHSRPGDAEVAARRGSVLRRPWEFPLETWRPGRSRAVAAVPNSVFPTVTNNGFNRSTENA